MERGSGKERKDGQEGDREGVTEQYENEGRVRGMVGFDCSSSR